MDDGIRIGQINKVELAHFSVKENLTSDREKPADISKFTITAHAANRTILESCLLYIRSYAATGPDNSNECFPLLLYACTYWPTHLKVIHNDIDLLLRIRYFIFLIPSQQCRSGLVYFIPLHWKI